MDGKEARYIGTLLQLGSLLGIVVCLITLTWSGMQLVFTKKDKAKRARARSRIKWSLVGLVVLFVTFIIVTYILAMFFLDLEY
jgi:cytochrome bd-type quinol oxidase subunit 2